MSNAAARLPGLPPPCFVHTAWRAHRALYRLGGGRFLWTT
jgi:F420H(2)-dependent quinone reductase